MLNIQQTILHSRSKATINQIAKYIGNSQKLFDELFDMILMNNEPLSQRCSWVAGYVIEAHPELIKKHFPALFQCLSHPLLHHTTKRNLMRLLQFVEIDEFFHAEAMNLCFNFVSSPKEKVAVKAFSLTILNKLTLIYPEIKSELIAIINDRWEHETLAFHSRAKKIIAAV